MVAVATRTAPGKAPLIPSESPTSPISFSTTSLAHHGLHLSTLPRNLKMLALSASGPPILAPDSEASVPSSPSPPDLPLPLSPLAAPSPHASEVKLDSPTYKNAVKSQR